MSITAPVVLPAIVPDSAALSTSEATSLAELEQVIERGQKVFVDVGSALSAIREQRLYRATHATFEQYCKDRWKFGRSYASRLIESSKTVEALLPIGNILPATETQVRPLLQFPVEARLEVWQTVVKMNQGQPLTARQIDQTIKTEIHIAASGPFKDAASKLDVPGGRWPEWMRSIGRR